LVHSKATYPEQSRAKPGDPRRQKTLADIMGSVSRAPDLREHRRRGILSALRTVARCLNKVPSDIPGYPGALQKELAEANYLQAGLSKRRWTNVRSLTLTALRVSGANIMPSRWQHSTFSPAWFALRQTCPSHYHLVGLSRFMNFCSSRGVEPAHVDVGTFEQFRENIENSLVRNSDLIYRATCRLWDSAHRVSDAWPAFRINLAPLPRQYSLDWSAFPKSLQKDVEAFLSHGGNRDVLSDDYAPSVKPATTIGRRKALRQMATALANSGKPVNEITKLGILVKPDNAKEILRFFLNRTSGQATEAIYSHACLLRTVARTWVKNVPDYAKLDKLCRNISSASEKSKGMKPRNRARLRQFDSESNIAALLGLSEKLFRLARQQDIGSTAALNYAMYAVAIEILIVAPMRIKNLVNLDLEKNVILPRDDRHGRVVLTVEGEDVKNGMPLEFELPESSSAMIIAYLREFRPRISSNPSKWLFPNVRGERRNTVGFGAQISTIIARHTGIEMNPHLFRHFAVKLIEQSRPGSAELARRLLAHTSIATTINSYSENKTAIAHKHYEELIQAKRDELGVFSRATKGSAHE
jgi:integrase